MFQFPNVKIEISDPEDVGLDGLLVWDVFFFADDPMAGFFICVRQELGSSEVYAIPLGKSAAVAFDGTRDVRVVGRLEFEETTTG